MRNTVPMIRFSRLIRPVLLLAACVVVSSCMDAEVDKRRAEAQAIQDELAKDAAEAKARSEAEDERPTNEGGGKLGMKDAQSLSVGPAKPGDVFKALDVEVMESMPPQFALRVEPNAPREIVLDELTPMSKTGVILAKVRYKLLADEKDLKAVGVRIAFGALKVGKYSLEIHVSPAPGKPHVKIQSFELTAR